MERTTTSSVDVFDPQRDQSNMSTINIKTMNSVLFVSLLFELLPSILSRHLLVQNIVKLMTI